MGGKDVVMSFSEQAADIGGKVGALATIIAVTPILGGIMMVENTISNSEQFPVTSAVVETTAKIGEAVGRFVVQQGPSIVIRALVENAVDATLSLPNTDNCSSD